MTLVVFVSTLVDYKNMLCSIIAGKNISAASYT